MANDLQYPLYLIPVPGGYASVVRAEPGGDQTHLLAVFFQQGTASSFMETCQLTGSPRALNNAREFRWLLRSLKHPVTQVAFDPSPDSPEVTAKKTVTIKELLAKQLVADQSPWNYPVFVIAQSSGFVSIEGTSGDGTPMKAVGLFTTSEKAGTYLQAAEESGTVLELADMQQVRSFLSALLPEIPAVALDPIVDKERRIARYGFRIDLLLDKYLVSSNDDPDMA